jgi:hypothetical protein
MTDCTFYNTVSCCGNCSECTFSNLILPAVAEVYDVISNRKEINEIIEDKIKRKVDLSKSLNNLKQVDDFSSTSLYNYLSGLSPEQIINIDFFIKNIWRTSSKRLGLHKAGECIRFLPYEFLAAECTEVNSSIDDTHIYASL